MIKTKEFLDGDFLLQTDAARQLYHIYAAHAPIIDYHNHLSPKDIAENRQFNNLTQIWLEGDHYKWRAMRAHGVDEEFCTGNASAEDKFMKWAETVPYTLRNPLYHWTHLELKNYFGVNYLLNKKSAKTIYHECTALLQTKEYSVQSLLSKMNVEVVCTTDDPCDDLRYHTLNAKADGVRMLPTFRPDKAYAFEDALGCKNYYRRLSEASGIEINNIKSLLQALERRVDFFHSQGCRLSDHGLENLPFEEITMAEATTLFSNVLNERQLTTKQCNGLRTTILIHLCRLYHTKGWVQQFHLGAMRNNNSRMMRTLGADTGFDSIGDFPQAKSMAKFFDQLDSTNQLTKTIIYNLNPADNALFATMIGNFNDGSVAGKMQWGSGWWFLDQKEGMEKQLNTLSNMGLLSHFVGMVTDSRSFLSFPRHEYFRRILCNILGNDIDRGELPNDIELIGNMVLSISYKNAKTYFNF
ncbi:MAG: glucuronate isomerase [Bacteroidota bacterium]